MATKINKYILLSAVIVLTLMFSCNCTKNEYNLPVYMGLLYPISITPANDTIQVGDTLWVNIDISDTLFDIGTQKKYYLPNCNFLDYLSVKRLSNNTKDVGGQEYANDKFYSKGIIGTMKNTGAFSIDFTPIYENHRYKLNGFIITRDTGVFVFRCQNFSFGNRIPQINLGKNKDGHQLLALFGATAYLINNGNTHYSIFLQHCKQENTLNPTEWTEDKFAYTFVVK